MSSINKRNLYGNEYNACALCEYQREVKLIKRLINLSEKAVANRPIENTCVECQVKLNTFSQISRIELNTLFYP